MAVVDPKTVLSDPNLSDSEKIQLISASQITSAAATSLMSQINTKLSAAGALRAKIQLKTATSTDITNYTTIKNQLATLQTQLATTGDVDPDTQQQIQQTLLESKLEALQGNENTLTFSQFSNWLDYILRTQAINPYSRQRVCDIDFISMLQNLGVDLSSQMEYLTALKNRLQKTITLGS